MIVCSCRNISESTVKGHLENRPPDLKLCWIAVSTEISGRPPVCKDGQGHCHEFGQNLVELLLPPQVTERGIA